MTDWTEIYRSRLVSDAEAARLVKPGDRVYSHMGAAHPGALLNALCDRAGELSGVEIVHCITLGDAPYCAPGMEGSFRHNSLFTAANSREAVNAGRADHIPVFLHEIEDLFENGTLPLDVAFIQVSPPDGHGNLSLGPGIDISLTAARSAKRLVVQVNDHMPRTLGNSIIHVSEADAIVERSAPLPVFDQGEITGIHRAIGRHVAALIPDGATLQIGVGGIPEAVLEALRGHKDLGVHTEMFSDGMVELIESGAVNNSRKTLHPGKTITTFVLGSRRVYDFVDDNPSVEFHTNRYVNSPEVIARNARMAAVNSALEIDLTGQVCSDSIGPKIYSGIGGQVDFIRGAAHSPGGVPVIALPATAKGGRVSRIVPRLKDGSGVVTSRGDVRWVATEHGAVNLHGRNLRQRAELLISIAAPEFREELERAAFAAFA
ncbi:MAG: acetyl-CoA hydrolase/transferase family protein [Bryobacteraceae bacterium]|nr:acetyl-CoA hydrolase/transferase family protein [Bryobacteraceae bacterium]